jgi:ABC-type sugar transport system ATPase subunit
VAVIYITHRLDEIYRLADRISVLRDGRHVLTAKQAELGQAELIRAMVGEEKGAPVGSGTPGGTLLRVVSPGPFDVAAGEIVGVVGLEGSGARELLWRIAGALPGGVAELAGEAFRPTDPGAALRQGVALLTGDRERSVIPGMPLAHVITLSALRRFVRCGWIQRDREEDAIAEASQRLNIVAARDTPLSQLSGGTQQKVSFARVLQVEPRVLLLDEPTRGIDVAAKREVHRLIHELAQGGAAVLWHATETDELIAHADRVVVLARGAMVGALGPGATRHEIVALAMGA